MDAAQLAVDRDEDFDEVELPEEFTRTDEANAANGGARLGDMLVRVTELHAELELIERALRTAEPASERHERVRTWVRYALRGFDCSVLRGLDEAQCALLYRWGDPPHVAGRPDALQRRHR
ncbi:MAG: hypothetical protein ACRDQA_28515 [Nocardioidaceae bacterium]